MCYGCRKYDVVVVDEESGRFVDRPEMEIGRGRDTRLKTGGKRGL